MKIMLYLVIGIFLLAGLYFVALSIYSRKQPESGLLNAQLRACPDTPNCVCSEPQGTTSYVEPLSYSSTAESAWNKIRQAIIETGGIIVTDQGGYLHARYETSLMRYIDDVELRIDADNRLIHIRSASRVGHSDMGANRKRVARIRAAISQKESRS